MQPQNAYEAEREVRIAANQKRLADLGLPAPCQPSATWKRRRVAVARLGARAGPCVENAVPGPGEGTPQRSLRSSSAAPAGCPRRSLRAQGSAPEPAQAPAPCSARREAADKRCEGSSGNSSQLRHA